MKTPINRFLVLLSVAIYSILAGDAVAQANFTILHTFSFLAYSTPWTNSDGAHPHGELIVSGNTLYGTTWQGTTNGNGTVFAMKTDGTGFTGLHDFAGPPSNVPLSPYFTNSDGAYPDSGLILSGNTLYGTTSSGGSSALGIVFAVNTDGTGFAVLHTFTGGNEGAFPDAPLLLSGSTLYGTTYQGGASNSGTVFAIKTDGTSFTNLYSFAGNSDGANPFAGLILSGDTLYGAASKGGGNGNGTVFAIKTDATGFTNIYSFTALIPYATNSGVVISSNSDGAFPYAGLTLSGNTLYGVANSGGSYGYGTVFALNPDGSGFKNLHNFYVYAVQSPLGFTTYVNDADGAFPNAGRLALSGNTLYGTTASGGASGSGIVFAVNTYGTGFTNLHSLVGGTEGAAPATTPTVSGNVLYGTTSYGGGGQCGTVFSLLIQPQLTIVSSGTNVILTWPTNFTGFALQSTTNLGSSAIWTTNLPAPLVVNGQYTVTNPISGTQQFFRLSQ